MSLVFSEDNLIEKPAIELFKSLGFSHQDCYNETFGENGMLGRETSTDVILEPRLKQALIKKKIEDLLNETVEVVGNIK